MWTVGCADARLAAQARFPMDKPGKTPCVFPTLPTGRWLPTNFAALQQLQGFNLIPGVVKTFIRLPTLAYSSRKPVQRTGTTAVPLSFAPGEAYQFDWSHEVVLIGGATVTVKVAHIRLCYSRMPFVRAYPRETQEMVFDAHDRAFAFFKGTCTRGIYDNLKAAVDAIVVGRERAYNRRFLQMCSHYLVEPVACTPSAGWEKGQVENQVGLVRERFFTPRLRVKNFEELNAWLLDRCVAYARAHRHPELRAQTIWSVFEDERPALVPYAGRFDGFHAVPASVSKTCLVRFDNNRYSVSAHAVGRSRTVR
jgi:Integrase core domain